MALRYLQQGPTERPEKQTKLEASHSTPPRILVRVQCHDHTGHKFTCDILVVFEDRAIATEDTKEYVLLLTLPNAPWNHTLSELLNVESIPTLSCGELENLQQQLRQPARTKKNEDRMNR